MVENVCLALFFLSNFFFIPCCYSPKKESGHWTTAKTTLPGRLLWGGRANKKGEWVSRCTLVVEHLPGHALCPHFSPYYCKKRV